MNVSELIEFLQHIPAEFEDCRVAICDDAFTDSLKYGCPISIKDISAISYVKGTTNQDSLDASKVILHTVKP